ncbi:hypothetical protein GE09DRAFT_1089299 [Coniochaeta sp. 2T2.1]|nr:hypothetical protein GE09DRAFT_1089299 [Coniochaeta sp. 2T2.1]
MKASTLLSMALGSYLSGKTLGSVAIGTFDNGIDRKTYAAAWINEADQEQVCGNGATALPAVFGSGTDFCNHTFRLSNGYTYVLRGCGGGTLTLQHGDGSFNSVCRQAGDNFSGYCGIHRIWVCG